ncbi:MAG: hypothetical protein V4689_05935 [Verrucomicrobiota bacterium]
MLAPPQADPSQAFLAKAYGISRQGFSQLCKRHEIDPAIFESVECAFIILSEKVKRSPLRQRLADPAEKARIQNLIYSWYETERTNRISQNGQPAAVLP